MKTPLALLSLLLASFSLLADETVTTNQDGSNVTGSLRKAIENATAGDRVIFGPNFSGDILLSQSEGELIIDKDLIIDGSSVPGGVTISGQNAIRVFSIIQNQTDFMFPTVELIGLNIVGGNTVESTSLFDAGGGGIHNAGTLTIRECTISGNRTGGGNTSANEVGYFGGRGGGIYSRGFLTVLNSTISDNVTGNGGIGTTDDMAAIARNGGSGGNGGGIFMDDNTHLSMLNSTVDGNETGEGGYGQRRGGQGGRGGGIFLRGSAEISNSTISNNLTGDGGGSSAVEEQDGGNGGDGGGVYVDASGSANFTSSTISGNTTGGGGINGSIEASPGQGGKGGGIHIQDCDVEITQCTIVDNRTGIAPNTTAIGGHGGGVWQTGSNSETTLKDSVLANNSVTAVGLGNDGLGPDYGFADDMCILTPEGLNCIGINETVEAPEHFPSPNPNGDLVGVPGAPFEPFLKPLADNGGPTQTHATYIDSPIVDPAGGATTSLLATDQRGLPRKSGARVDLGAYEYFFANPRLVAPRRLITRVPRRNFVVRVISPVTTRLTARATAGARAVVRGRAVARRVVVNRIKRRSTLVRLTARDQFGKVTRKNVRVIYRPKRKSKR